MLITTQFPHQALILKVLHNLQAHPAFFNGTMARGGFALAALSATLPRSSDFPGTSIRPGCRDCCMCDCVYRHTLCLLILGRYRSCPGYLPVCRQNTWRKNRQSVCGGRIL